MKGPRYVEDNRGVLTYRQQCWNNHKEKLKKISQRRSFENSVFRQTQGLEYYNQLKANNRQFR
jgi:hypothetical protein